MYPNDNQQTNPYDYLNQIAPKTPKKFDVFRQKPVMIGAIILAVFTGVMIFAAIVGSLSGGTTSIKTLSARLASTESTVDSATPNIKNTKLRALNGELKIQLTNIIRDLNPVLVTYKITSKSIDKNIISAESNTKILATLEDARLNVQYDRVYAIEMNTQLEKTILLMRQINNSTRNNKTKVFTDVSIENLEKIQVQFEDFNAANG